MTLSAQQVSKAQIPVMSWDFENIKNDPRFQELVKNKN